MIRTISLVFLTACKTDMCVSHTCSEDIPVDMIRGNKAQCMWQHTRIFCLTRIPMHHCDKLVQHDMASIKHIIVLVRDQVYKLPVYKQQPGTTTWRLLTRQEIEQ